MLLVPTLGPLHVLHPRYNAQTVVEWVKAQRPDRVVLASYGAEELAAHAWREQNELSFFYLLPWAEAQHIPVAALDQKYTRKAEAEQFREALGQFPKGKPLLEQLGVLDLRLQTLLTQPLTPEDFSKPEFLQGLRDYLEGVIKLFGEGPATGYRRERMQGLAQRIAEVAGCDQPEQGGGGAGEKRKREEGTAEQPSGTTGWSSSNRGAEELDNAEKTVVLVDVLDYPVLKELLPYTLHLKPITPSEAERQRSILDRAWRLEANDDWVLLLSQLQEIDGPEAMYLASQIYLAAGQTEDAFTLLEQLVHSDFQHPAYLPGYVLARYGQLADTLGQREKALRAYKAVLALSWVPAEAREMALAGQHSPFQLGTPSQP